MEKRKLIIEDCDGTQYEVAGSGGGGSQPAPNSVGSQEIVDESIKKEDLEKDIQDKLDVLDESNVITEEELENDWQEAMNNAGIDVDTDDVEDISDTDLADDWQSAINEVSKD